MVFPVKHFRILLPLLILVLVFFRYGSTKTVEINGKSFTVDTKNHTISDSTYTYQYTVSGDTITVFYPDGSRFWHQESGYGWSEDYDRFAVSAYTGGMTLTAAAAKAEDSKLTIGILMIFLNTLILGFWLTLRPEKAWHFMGNNYIFHRNELPTEGQIVWVRVWGVLLILLSAAALYR